MKILWICFVWPEPGSSAAGSRTMQLLNTLRNAGHRVKVCSACQENEAKFQLSQAGFDNTQIPLNDSVFNQFLVEYNPEIVFFDRFMVEEQFSWRVKELCPDALRILDTIDLHSLRRSRQRAVEQGKDALQLDLLDLNSEDALREIAAIYRSDLSLIMSDKEFEFLQTYYQIPKDLMEISRFIYRKPQSINPYEQRKHFVVIGNFNHAPNLDSVKYLKSDIWPGIRSALKAEGLEDIELHVYGAYPSQQVMQLNDSKLGFIIKGWAKEVFSTLEQYRVNLAALRFGAGLKGKIADGWACGTPCVGTDIAAEGMNEGLMFGGAIADDPATFIEQSLALYTNRDLWQKASDRGVLIIEELYSAELNAKKFLERIEECTLKSQLRRQANFIGQMLWHHKNRSTEYFSRWLEEKKKHSPDKTAIVPGN